ncbi:MAG TPA: arginase, partial [Gaiellaceae bacterium]
MTTTSSRPVAVIGAGLDLGAGRRGVDMGPSAIRYAGLAARLAEIGREVHDEGDIHSPVPEATEAGEGNAHYLGAILAACGLVAELVSDAVERGRIPLTLGGDHSIAMGTLGGMAATRGAGGVLWIDAHGDLNRPETSPTGNVHGMPLAAALGAAGAAFESEDWPTPSVVRAALVGVRSLDAGERDLIGELAVRVFTMTDLDRIGVERALREALAFLAGTSFLHVSFDLDAIDPMFAPGVG